MKIICMVCGHSFRNGNNPITGNPNGFGMVFLERPNDVFNVCSSCMMFKHKAVIRTAEEFKKGGLL